MSLAKLTNHVLPIRNQVRGYTPAVPLRPSPSHYSSSKTNTLQQLGTCLPLHASCHLRATVLVPVQAHTRACQKGREDCTRRWSRSQPQRPCMHKWLYDSPDENESFDSGEFIRRWQLQRIQILLPCRGLLIDWVGLHYNTFFYVFSDQLCKGRSSHLITFWSVTRLTTRNDAPWWKLVSRYTTCMLNLTNIT